MPLRRLGLGGTAGGGFTFGLGGSVRYWASRRLAFQISISRGADSYADAGFGYSYAYEFAVLQFAPSVIYRITEPKVDDDVVFTPYVGGGLNVFQTTATAEVGMFGASARDSDSSSNVGFQAVGGVELWPTRTRKFAVSADLGYYSTSIPFSAIGYQVGGFAFSASLHYYVR